jgi:hemerythrin-like domain-containing protein
MYNAYIGQLLYEHIRMRRVARVLERQLDVVARCEEPDFILLIRALDYLRGLPARLHHSREDILFERLRAVDTSLARELAVLQGQHQEIRALEDLLQELAMAAAKDGQAAYPRLLEFGRDYLRIQKSHSQLEERSIFPVAARKLKPEDWQRLEYPRLVGHGDSIDAEMHGRVLSLYRDFMGQAKAA